MSHIIQSLWIGPELSKLEQLCLKSFIDHGHEFHLYTYEEVANVPDGVIIKDGNEILDKSEIFRYKNGSVSAFSNLFRFTMLYKKGGYWADTDLLCVRPFKFEEDFVISSEPNAGYNQNIINAGLLKFKKSKEALEGIIIQREQKQAILEGKVTWSSGPKTVAQIVNKYNLHKYILPWRGICSCAWDHGSTIFKPNIKYHNAIIDKMSDIPEEMVCIHLWNEVLRRNKIDKNSTFDPDSIFELFKKKHGIM